MKCKSKDLTPNQTPSRHRREINKYSLSTTSPTINVLEELFPNNLLAIPFYWGVVSKKLKISLSKILALVQ